MNVGLSAACRTRFLAPRLARCAGHPGQADAIGAADTPAADACVRLYLVGPAAAGGPRATFAAFGPPEVVACADWLCERVEQMGFDAARRATTADMERALALAPAKRYAAMLALDALTHALDDLKDSTP